MSGIKMNERWLVIENDHTVITSNIPTEEEAMEIVEKTHKIHQGRYYEVKRFDPYQNRFIGVRQWRARYFKFNRSVW